MKNLKRTALALSTLIALLCVSGCSDDPHEYTRLKNDWFCPDSVIEKKADFTLQCLKNANPKSDEEPEDWIHKCEEMAEKTYCKLKTYKIIYYTATGKENPYLSTEISRKLIEAGDA